MINKLYLTNFRSYRDSSFEFSPLTVIVGPNGSGKTNIIEALNMISTGRSFRATHDKEVIAYDAPFARIKCEPIDITLVNGVRLQKQTRIFEKTARLLDVLGHHKTVLFTPTSMSLVDGSPALRRQFLDILLSQSNTIYARQLLEYQRVLKQRNGLLHAIINDLDSTDTLPLWDKLLVEAGIPIIKTRFVAWQEIKSGILKHYQLVSGNKKDVMEVDYHSSVDKKTGLDFESDEAISKRYYERLAERRPAELRMGRTVVGPHRDDLIIILNNKLVADYGSRGEMRTAVVALKLFEYHYMKKMGNNGGPTLLFDDVFSEFDPVRRKAVTEIMPEAQMIFTATDLDHVGKLPSKASVIELNK